MSEQTPWINAEILDNPSGEVTDADIEAARAEEEALAAQEEVSEPPQGDESEPPVPDPSDAESEPQSEEARQRDGILRELRETRDELKKERQANAERNQILEQRLQALFEAREKAESTREPEEVAPDPEEDPLGHLSYQQRKLAEQQAALLNMTAEERQQAQQQEQLQNVVAHIQTVEKQFIEKESVDPKVYDSALDFARENVKGYYVSMGFPEQEAERIAQVEQIQFAAAALQRGVNPAEARYKMALANGFKVPEPAVEEAQAGESVDKEQLAKTLQFKQQAVGEAKSLGSVGGGSGKRRITLEELANAPADLFDKITSDPSLWEKINVEGSLMV